MALPKIVHPTYNITLPSTKKKINIRPFTVQEEKLLFMAKASDNPADILSAVKQIIRNCVLDKVDVDKLATFDIEYLFIKLRAKSVGEVIDLEYTEPGSKDPIKFKINLDNVEVNFNPDHTNKILVKDDIGIIMRYPSLEEIAIINNGENEEDAAFEVLLSCIDKIFDKDSVYSDFSKKELDEFVNNLPFDAMQKLKNFFETMPVVKHVVKLKNKQGEEKTIELKGISSFFL